MASNSEALRYSVWIPENIELDGLLLEYPVNNVPNAKDYLLFILSSIRVRSEFTPINSIQFQKIVDNYHPLFQWLIDRGIIERDNTYIPDEKSKGYRFTPGYITALKECYIRKKTLIKRLTNPSIRLEIIEETNNNETPVIIDEVIDSGYGYEPLWFKAKEVAELLKLKPNKMRQGLRHFGIIPSIVILDDTRDKTKKYAYAFTYIAGGWRASLWLNGDFIDEIRALAIENPIWFPPKTKIS